MNQPLLVVLNTCPHDHDLAIAALKACARFGKVEGTLLLAYPAISGFNTTSLYDHATKAFSTVYQFSYPDWTGDRAWPRPQNHAWQTVARRIASGANKLTAPGWLWMEPDSVPLQPGWLDTLTAAYVKTRKLFAGVQCHASGQPYMNGVGIYPMNVVEPLQNTSALYTSTVPFDIAAGPGVMKSFADLRGQMMHWRKEQGGGKCATEFPKANLTTLLNFGYVFAHGCTDATLHNLVGRVKQTGAGVKLPKPTATRPTFYHSGDLGDIIYALPLIKRFGGGKLFLGPYIPSAQRIHKTRATLDRTQFDWIAPLLRQQPYLDSVEFTETDPGADYDLNLFRHTWFNKQRQCSTLVDCYFEHFKAGKFDHCETWLTCLDPGAPIPNAVTVHRSSRYHNESFPWRTIVGHYAGKLYFVGQKEEFKTFNATFGPVSEFAYCSDAHEMAKAIQASVLFIGNQSFPNALALGLRKRIIQETCAGTPDCVLNRPENTYLGLQPIVLQPIPKRIVTRQPDPNGVIVLGPGECAYGLGDMLTITPVIRQLGPTKCKLQLPHAMAHMAGLFNGLCPVELVEDFPVWPGNGQREHQAVYKLRLMGLDVRDYLPSIKLTKDEIVFGQQEHSHKWIKAGDPLAFCPTGSAKWAHEKSRSISYWEKFFKGEKRTILQFGRHDYPLLKGAIRMPFYNLRELASVYSAIGQLVSIDTGDLHLMLAVGGKCFVCVPDESRNYSYSEWQYQNERITYAHFDKGREEFNKWRDKL